MSESRPNVLCCGLLHTGSSAVVDLLREVPSVARVPGEGPGEFNEFREIGLVGDLVEGLIEPGYPSRLDERLGPSGLAREWRLRRKVVARTVKSLLRTVGAQLVTRRPGQSTLSPNPAAELANFADWIRTQDRVSRQRRLLDGVVRQLHQHPGPDGFERRSAIAARWIRELRSLYASDNEFLLLDQGITIGIHQSTWPAIFRPFKLVVVHRDPFDQMGQLAVRNILGKQTITHFQLVYGVGRLGGFRAQLRLVEARLRALVALQSQLPPHEIMCLSFESLVQQPESTVSSLFEFLGIEHQPSWRYFRPEDSARNIGLGARFLKDEERAIIESSPVLELRRDVVALEEARLRSLHGNTRAGT